MTWGRFLSYNLLGSAAYSVAYILIGFFFGKKWIVLEAWLGPTASYSILAGIVLIVLGVLLRNSLFSFVAKFFS